MVLSDPRIPMAAERTLLAWIRTGLAMMGFGFVVARFGLFLREILKLQNPAVGATHGFSLWIGVALVGLGVAVTIMAAIRHKNYLRALSEIQPITHYSSTLEMFVAAILALIGIATFVYLLTVR